MPKEQIIAKVEQMLETLSKLESILAVHDQENETEKQEIALFAAEKKSRRNH